MSAFFLCRKEGGHTDDRYLWHEMLRVIDQVRPMWVIGENVNGITTMVESFEITEVGSESSIFNEGNGVHRYRSEQTFTIERICRDLESKGYSVQPMLIPAAAVGAPHRRDRIFILAYNVTDSDLQRCNESKPTQESRRKDRFACEENIKGGIRGLHPKERWASFPSVSPVYRGNDGLPFDVDNLTISFSKWRTESLKAYGNAIVPQVIYQIMKVINDISINN